MKQYPYWQKVERDQWDKKHDGNLCPVCKQDTCERLVGLDEDDEETILQERCKRGCFTTTF